MAQRTELVCDRCGKDIINTTGCYAPTYSLKDSSAKITLWRVGEPRYSQGQRIDFCIDCFEKFVIFLEGDVKR